MQKQRVYDAESIANEQYDYDLEDLDELVEFSSNVLELRLVKERFGKWLTKTVYCSLRRSNSQNSIANDDGIEIDRNNLTVGTVIHELAHVIQFRINKGKQFAYHGDTFTSIYLYLIRCALGKGAHKILKEQFDLAEIEYNDWTVDIIPIG